MKKYALYFIAFLIFCLFCIFPHIISAQITFEKTYGGSNQDYGSSVEQTTDGGYIIAGRTSSFDIANGDVYLIKIDSIGDTIWTKTYGWIAADYGYSVQQTIDGGYIVAGETGADFYLIKTNAIGDTLWTKAYGGLSGEYGYSVQQTTDSGYIIAGFSNVAFNNDVYLIKTTSLGDTVWTKLYGGNFSDQGNSVKQTTDGGYIIVGNTSSFGAGNADVYLIKTNSVGDTIWTKTYGGIFSDVGMSVQQTTDGGYIIVGYTLSFGAGNADVYLIKTNLVGDTLWTKTYGGIWDEWGYSVRQTTDSGYIIVGYTDIFGDDDVYLIKTNSVGDTLWTKTYDGTSTEVGYSIQQTIDGGYIIVGETKSFGAGSDDVYLIKTDSLGCVYPNSTFTYVDLGMIVSFYTSPMSNSLWHWDFGDGDSSILQNPSHVYSNGTYYVCLEVTNPCGTDIYCDSVTVLVIGVKEKKLSNSILVSPNPFSTSTEIFLHPVISTPSTRGEKSYHLELYDILGRNVVTSLANTQSNSQGAEVSFELQRGSLPEGLYIFHIKNENQTIATGKLIVHN
ncbi:MAG TPA: T9SS type A sorting domain-containing protein [bacterium]|nr:T9SS type A sorting domain-containing protein [bacterium]